MDRILVLRELTEGLRASVDVIDEQDRRLHVIFVRHGRLREGGGPFETVIRTVAATAPDGRFSRVLMFDPDDVAGSGAALRDLAAT